VHPDKYAGDKRLAAEAFRVLTGAYEALAPLVG
jgi:curved DNA-binding protein CbpA